MSVALSAVAAIVFVVVVLAIVAYALFALSPFAHHVDRFRESGRQRSPRLD